MKLTLNQHRLADALGVDRTTVTQYQREGMPFEPAARGKPGSYDAIVCQLWKYGREYAKARGLPNLGAPITVVLCYLKSLDDELPEFWWPHAVDFAIRAGAPEDEAEAVVSRALNILGRPR